MRFYKKEAKLKDGTTCILRSPEENEAAEMIEYKRMVSAETHFMIRYPEEVDSNVDEEKERLRDFLESDNNIMIAAFIDGEVAGNASVGCARNLLKIKHRGAFGIGVKEKYWNKGIGNLLVSEILNAAKEMGLEQVELGVYSDNLKAQALYKKYGFEVWGTTKNAYKLKDGTYKDEITMGIIL